MSSLIRTRHWALAAALLASFSAARADDRAPSAPVPAPVTPGVAAADPVKALAERCRYVPAAFEMTVADPIRFGPAVLVEKLTFPSPVASVDPERNDVVKAKLFRTESPEPALVVFLGGWRFDPATPALAARFAEETGVQALYLDLPFQGERTPRGKKPGQLTFSEDLEQNLATFAQAAQDVERAVDWMVRERKVDPKRLAIVGTSLGGYVAADLYGLSDRFSAAVVQIAGGDVASVVFNGNFLTVRIREALVARGLDEDAVRERMRPLDPATWARKERRDGLLLIAAEKDEIVPLDTVKALAEAYGGARLVVMDDSGHMNPKGLESHFSEAVEHLRKRLLPAREPLTGAGAPATPPGPVAPAPAPPVPATR
jgi:dienelactone hydrolase